MSTSEPNPRVRHSAVRAATLANGHGRPVRQPSRGSHAQEAIAPELSGSAAGSEVEERDRRAVIRRIKETHFPAVKTLEEFNFQAAPHISAALMKKLSEGE